MPRKKVSCPTCDGLMAAASEHCRKCKPTYLRTQAHREKMRQAVIGKPKPWLRGRSRPEHSRMMKEWWTPERREQKRQEMLARNPDARYHGLSAKGAARLRAALGRCEVCDMQEHARRGETGWDSYHAKRTMNPS